MIAPSVRLVNFDIPAVHNALAPDIRLAHQPGSQCDNGIKEGGWNGNGAKVNDTKPGLLVSYFYVEPFLEHQAKYSYRDWVLDSGAFSAHNSGAKIDLSKYIDFCLKLLQEDQTLTEVFALDVIGDHEASLKNAEEMWRQGVPAIPCYHIGEPEEVLYHLAKTYPKIALGGVAMQRGDLKFNWCQQCFARVWPKRIHGFGMSSEEMIYGLPFHSVDATNWELAPCAFGNWQKFGKMSVRGSNQDLRSQVKHYLDMEAKARVRWAKQMAELDALPEQWPQRPAPVVRLAVEPHSGRAENNWQGTNKDDPSVRLAVEAHRKQNEVALQSPASPKPKTKPAPALVDPSKIEFDQKWAKNWWT